MLCIIPARGESKRLPRKNVRNFLGKPLIAWTIECAKESGVFDRILALTDNAEIADVAKKVGADVPFIEPAELAGDSAYVGDAVSWALIELEKGGYRSESFMLLEPSAVGRTVEQIQEAAKIFSEHVEFDSLAGVSVVPAHFSYSKQLQIGADGAAMRMGDNALLKNLTHRNQDIEKSYYINSQLYAFRRKNIFEGDKSLWGNSTYGYVMDDAHLADIDTENDWLIAETKLRGKHLT